MLASHDGETKSVPGQFFGLFGRQSGNGNGSSPDTMAIHFLIYIDYQR